MPVVIRQMLEGEGEAHSMGMLVYSLALMVTYLCLAANWSYAALIARLAPDVARPRALAWLMQDFFVAIMFASVAFYSVELRVAAALAALPGAGLRIGSLRLLKKARAAETEAPLEDVNPGQ
ncbi:hypothetical protein [Rhodanobacter sp. BL-MT-08]